MYIHSLGESSQDTKVKRQKSDFGGNGMYMCIPMYICICNYVCTYVRIIISIYINEFF